MYVYSRGKLLNFVFQNIYRSIPPISTKWKITSRHNWTHLTQKKTIHMMLVIQILAWDRHKNVAGLNRLMGFQPLLILIIISPMSIHM